MDIRRVYENLKQLKTTDLAPGTGDEIMQAIVSCTKRLDQDLPHYVVPKEFGHMPAVDDATDHIETVHAVAGAGIMAFADRIRVHASDDVIIYEPDDGGAYLFLSQINLNTFFNHCKVHLLKDLKTFAQTLHQRYEWWKTFEAWKSPPTASHYPNELQAFHHHLMENGMTGKVNQNTLHKLYFLWAAHERINLKKLKNYKCAVSEPSAMKDVPAVLVGAGPSLRPSLPALKKISRADNMLIIAASTTLRVLIPEGIFPHFVIIIEGEQQTHFDNIPHLDRLGVLAHLQTHPVHLENPFKNIFWFDQETSPLRPLTASLVPGAQPLKFSGNVISAAFLLSAFWGCRPIAFTGMDLAYQTGNKYMKGLEKKEASENPNRKFHDVPAQNATSRLTAPPEFISYAHNLETAIEQIQKTDPNFRVVNASIGGRRIKGTVEMSLEEFAGQFSLQDPVGPILSRAIASWTSLPEKAVLSAFSEHRHIYQQLMGLLDDPEALEKNGTRQKNIHDLLKRLPEFNTGVARIIPWVRHIQSAPSVSASDLDALKTTVRQILDKIDPVP